jgi:hypothetical protein
MDAPNFWGLNIFTITAEKIFTSSRDYHTIVFYSCNSRVVIAIYPFEEQIRDFWNTYGDLIGLVGGGFAAAFYALLIDRLKNRSKNKSRK